MNFKEVGEVIANMNNDFCADSYCPMRHDICYKNCRLFVSAKYAADTKRYIEPLCLAAEEKRLNIEYLKKQLEVMKI